MVTFSENVSDYELSMWEDELLNAFRKGIFNFSIKLIVGSSYFELCIRKCIHVYKFYTPETKRFEKFRAF